MLYAKCHFMQDTANPAKSGSAGCYFALLLRGCHSNLFILVFGGKLLPRDVENLWIFCTKLTASGWNSLMWT